MLAALLAVTMLSGCPGTSNQGGGGTVATPPEEAASKTILLAANQGPNPRKQPASKGSEESVAWMNNDDRGHTIRFTDWPFREPQQDIHVEAGQRSKVFHVYRQQDPGLYSYGIFPPVPGDPGLAGAQVPPSGTGPPDPPAVEVGD